MRRSMLFVIASGALGLSACVHPMPIAFEGQANPRYLRCTLRPAASVLYSSNYLGIPGSVPAGTPALVTMFSQQRVDLTLNNVSGFKMYPLTVPFDRSPEVFIKKYFVDNPRVLGLDKLTEPRRKNIQSGTWELGMTREEVYTALGPPNWLDFEIDATNVPYETILQKNRWVYRESDIMGATWWPVQRVFNFDAAGKLTSTIP